MKGVIRFFKAALVIGVVGATLVFGANQALAGTRTKATCPPPNVTCTTSDDCTRPCLHFNGGTGVCQSGCCYCFL
jgi:hypothetical protein